MTKAAKLFEEYCSVRHLSCVNKAAIHRARYRTEANWRCDVSFERPLITSLLVARSYATPERKL